MLTFEFGRGDGLGQLRVPTLREFRKYLKQHGFVRLPKRGKGDHEVWRNPDTGKQLTVDGLNSKRPGVGLFKAMLRQAGLDEEDFR